MKKDMWHYPRAALAEQVLGLFENGLSNAFTFFAPRRMGKTEFLLKDILPLAESKDWYVFYYSFLDADQNAASQFSIALTRFAIETKALKRSNTYLQKIGGAVGGISGDIEFGHLLPEHEEYSLANILNLLAKKKKLLLLLDEVQTLAMRKENSNFLASLRTSLDTSKDTIKVIFTGSSREGLTQMFSNAKAPFFHFGQNLNFPSLERPFINHLCKVYNKVSTKQLDSELLWSIFLEFNHSPQLIRSLVERVALNPLSSVLEAKDSILNELYTDGNYKNVWQNCSELEKIILSHIMNKDLKLYSKVFLAKLASILGVEEIKAFTIQSAVRSLIRANILIKSHDNLIFEDPNFKRWIKENQ